MASRRYAGHDVEFGCLHLEQAADGCRLLTTRVWSVGVEPFTLPTTRTSGAWNIERSSPSSGRAESAASTVDFAEEGAREAVGRGGHRRLSRRL